jgi:hypothetical protein
MQAVSWDAISSDGPAAVGFIILTSDVLKTFANLTS